MKKFVLLSLTVLLGVSLFLAGCGDPETGPAGTSGSVGRIGDGHVSGTPSIAGLQAMIDRYDGTGAELVLDNITLAGPGTVDLKGVKAHFVGTATLSSGVIINALSATVGFADGAKIAGTSSDAIIGSSTVFTSANVTGGALVAAPVSGADDFDEVIGGVTAVETLTLASDGPVIPSNLKVYVFGTLRVNGDAAAPSNSGAKVIAIGNVTLKPNTQANTAVLADASKVDVSGAAITLEPAESGGATAEYKLPATFAGREIYVSGENDVLTLSTVTSITAYLRGNGLVKLPAAVTSVNITGSGRVQFTDSTAGGVAFAAGSRIETGVNGYAQFDYGFKTPATENTTVTLSGDVRIAADKTIGFGHASGTVTLTEGTTVSLSGGSPVLVLTAPATAGLKLSGTTTSVVTVKAGGEVDVSTEDVTFTGDVAFGGNLTLTDKGVTFDGTAFFAPDAVITLTAADDSAITLKDGHALAIGAPTNTAAVWQYFLTASGADVTLTPAANTKLTVAADGKTITQDTSTSGAHGITVGGEAVLVSGSTYKVASESGKVGTLTLDSGAVLTLGPETILPEGYEDKAPPQIVLTGAASGGAVLTGEGTLIAGGTEITGGNTDGTWTASGAAGLVTIAEDSITGDAAGVTLTAGGHANAEIKVTNATLTADGVAITVVSDPYGKVTLVGSATDGDQGKLLLKGGANPGTLVADSSKTSATVTSETAITLQNGSSSAGTDAAVSGTIPGILIKVASEQNPTTAVELGSIGGGTSANQDALITAPSTAVDSVIKTGSYVKAGS